MGNSTTTDTPESWNAASRGYADKVAPVLMESYAQAFVDALGLDEGARVLEVAAGSGAMTMTLARHAASVLATDFSPTMIDVLGERLAAAGVDNVDCQLMDGQALELEDGSFDGALCAFGLMLFPDRAKGFSELHRVLRPGSRASVAGWAGPDRFEGFGLFTSALQRAFPNMPAPTSPPPVFSLANPQSFKAEMEAAGFVDVEVDYVTRELVLDDFDDLWDMFTVGAPPVQVLFDRVGDEGRTAVKTALREVVSERYGEGAIRASNAATLGRGRKA